MVENVMDEEGTDIYFQGKVRIYMVKERRID